MTKMLRPIIAVATAPTLPANPDHLIVILGAGHAGGRAAEALRGAGFPGKITLVGNEKHPPYERPPLSKDLLAGNCAVERTYLKLRAFYDEAGIALHLGAAAVEIDRRAQRIRLANGTALPYDSLLLTLGARARRLPPPGATGLGIYYLRDIDDCLTLRDVLGVGKRLIVIGAGFIGLEAAAVAVGRGCAVTVIEAAATPLARVAPPALGEFFATLHRRHGVALRTGAAVTAIERHGEDSVVTLASGERLSADAVLVGIGAVPNSELAAAADLAVDDGVIVDAHGRTSDPSIFAAGDVTRHFNPLLGRRIRLEAWQNAQNQAIAVAKVMAANLTGGETEPYAELPWFWSDQYDVNLQTAGAPERWDRLVWRGHAENGRFTLFSLADGVPVGGATVNNARDMRFVKLLIAASRKLDPERLADPAVKLADLMKGAG
jgi:3-phenylpropionate/trans-cinnamate dioxygenase ferredoxin reductase component